MRVDRKTEPIKPYFYINCFCKRKLEVRNECKYTDLYLGRFTFKCIHEVCPVHGIVTASHWLEAFEAAKKKRLQYLLLQKRHPKNHEYLSVEEVARLTNTPVERLNGDDTWLYSTVYHGERIYLKESVDKYLANNKPGWIKLVDYKTEENHWIKRVLLHDNYDVDVEFYDGTCRRKNLKEYIEGDSIFIEEIPDVESFLKSAHVEVGAIWWPLDNYVDSRYLYDGEKISPFEGGIRPYV